MAYDFSFLKRKGAEIEEWLKREYLSIHTGQASPGVLDGIPVEAYGTKMPISQVATVVTEGPRSLVVTPWDETVLKALEKALHDSDLGLSISVGEQGVRVTFPDLTAERRSVFAKQVRQKEEQAKISLRAEREKVWDDIQHKERSGEMPEDDKFRAKEDMQRIVDSVTKSIEEMADRKEKDVLEN